MEQLQGLVWLSRPGPHSTGSPGHGYKNCVYVFAFHTVAYSILPLQYHRLQVMHTSDSTGFRKSSRFQSYIHKLNVRYISSHLIIL